VEYPTAQIIPSKGIFPIIPIIPFSKKLESHFIQKVASFQDEKSQPSGAPEFNFYP